MLHPYDQDRPRAGSAPPTSAPQGGYGAQLSNSWFYPERAERIAQLAGSGKHDTRSTIAMQYETTPFAAKLKAMFEPAMAQPLKQAIDALPTAERDKAREALSRLLAFDGDLRPTSADAVFYEAFLQESARQIFQDELGPEGSPAWQALVETANLLLRPGRPPAGPRRQPVLGRRAHSAEGRQARHPRRSLAAVSFAEGKLGTDRKAWQWGKRTATPGPPKPPGWRPS